MEKETKYRFREEHMPYYYEEDIKDGVITLKIFEIYDGKEVKWGVREDYNSVMHRKYCRSTPIFENALDKYGYDKERIIRLDNDKFVILGRLNNSEVLCKINDHYPYDKNLVEIEDFGGEEVSISKEENEKVLVSYKEEGFNRRVFFDCKEFKPYSNVFDASYINSYFIKSYQINGKIRVFVGMLNTSTGVVKENGYDVNKREFITFPLDEYGLIDEKQMNDDLKDDVIGFDIDKYLSQSKINLITFLRDLGIDGFVIVDELFNRNYPNVKKRL